MRNHTRNNCHARGYWDQGGAASPLVVRSPGNVVSYGRPGALRLNRRRTRSFSVRLVQTSPAGVDTLQPTAHQLSSSYGSPASPDQHDLRPLAASPGPAGALLRDNVQSGRNSAATAKYYNRSWLHCVTAILSVLGSLVPAATRSRALWWCPSGGGLVAPSATLPAQGEDESGAGDQAGGRLRGRGGYPHSLGDRQPDGAGAVRAGLAAADGNRPVAEGNPQVSVVNVIARNAVGCLCADEVNVPERGVADGGLTELGDGGQGGVPADPVPGPHLGLVTAPGQLSAAMGTAVRRQLRGWRGCPRWRPGCVAVQAGSGPRGRWSVGGYARADYLTAKRLPLDYATALEHCWLIATGVIEGVCRYLVRPHGHHRRQMGGGRSRSILNSAC